MYVCHNPVHNLRMAGSDGTHIFIRNFHISPAVQDIEVIFFKVHAQGLGHEAHIPGEPTTTYEFEIK